jgi:hypothetical protein
MELQTLPTAGVRSDDPVKTAVVRSDSPGTWLDKLLHVVLGDATHTQRRLLLVPFVFLLGLSWAYSSVIQPAFTSSDHPSITSELRVLGTTNFCYTWNLGIPLLTSIYFWSTLLNASKVAEKMKQSSLDNQMW